LTFLFASPLGAQTFRAENRVDVVPTDNGFAVQSGRGVGARGLTVTVEEPGAMLKSAQARRFCRDAFTRLTK